MSYTFETPILPVNASETQRLGGGLFWWRRQGYMCMPGAGSHMDSYQRFTMASFQTVAGKYDFKGLADFMAFCKQKNARAWIGWGENCGPNQWGPWIPDFMKQEKYGTFFTTNGESNFYLNLNLPDVQKWFTEALVAFAEELKKYDTVYAIQMLGIGRHGEGYLPWDMKPDNVALPTAATVEWMIDLFESLFGGKYHLTIPARDDYRTYYAMTKPSLWGIGRMSIGDDKQMANIRKAMQDAKYGLLVRDRWQRAPVWGELIGATAGDDFIMWAQRHVKEFHVSLLGDGNVPAKFEAAPYFFWTDCRAQRSKSMWTDQMIQEWSATGRMCGPRLRTGKIVATDAYIGEPWTISAEWFNQGNAPLYDPWSVSWQLRDKTTVVLEGKTPLTSKMTLPGEPTVLGSTMHIPETVAPGDYQLVVHLPPYGKTAMNTSFPLDQPGRQSDGSYAIGSVRVDRLPVTVDLERRITTLETENRRIQQQVLEIQSVLQQPIEATVTSHVRLSQKQEPQ